MKKIVAYTLVTSAIIGVGILALTRRDVPVAKLKKKYTNQFSKFLELDGMKVHYRDEGNGFPLVMIHGISSSLNTWEGWVGELKKDCRVITLDLPGFALTGPNQKNDYSIDFYVSFMKSFLDQLNINSCYMAGNSLGGYITWNLAVKYPTLLKKMILLDAAGYPFTSTTTPFVFKLAQSSIAPLFKKITPRFILGKVIQQVYGDKTRLDEEAITRYYEHALRSGNRNAFLKLVKNIDFSQYENLKNINIPTLIMWGEKDAWLKSDLAKRFNEDLSGSKLIMYPGVGHIPMEEIPEQTAKDARTFLLAD